MLFAYLLQPNMLYSLMEDVYKWVISLRTENFMNSVFCVIYATLRKLDSQLSLIVSDFLQSQTPF